MARELFFWPRFDDDDARVEINTISVYAECAMITFERLEKKNLLIITECYHCSGLCVVFDSS